MLPPAGRHSESARQPVSARPAATIEVALLYPDRISAGSWKRLANNVRPEETGQATRFVFEEDRQACLAAHWLKRHMLSRAFPAADPLSWRFARGSHGKPYVVEPYDIHFNVSHCRGLVACAVRSGAPVGIDVEFTGCQAPEEIVEHYFSEAETAWWHAQSEEDKAAAFFSLWTAKEAFIKATGRGLSQAFPHFTFSTQAFALLPKGDWANEAPMWRLYQPRLQSPHALAAAWIESCDLDETVNLLIVEPDVCLHG